VLALVESPYADIKDIHERLRARRGFAR